MEINNEAKENHLDHWLYKEARELTEHVRNDQILKGVDKYPVPLGDAGWTPEQLVLHAMQENVDQNHYITALAVEIRKMREALAQMGVELQFYKKFYEAEMKKPLD